MTLMLILPVSLVMFYEQASSFSFRLLDISEFDAILLSGGKNGGKS